MTLTIHIGMPKTGTTTVQQALHDNWGALGARGIDYMLRPHAPMGDHVHIANALGFGGELMDERAAAAYRTMLAERDPARHAVLSTEHFSFFRSDPGAVARLREMTGPARIVAVLRNQVDWLPSMYGEGVKRGRQATLEQAARNMLARCDYADYLAPWEEAFGRDAVEVVVYEEGDVLDQFVEIVLRRDAHGERRADADEIVLERPPRANATPPQLLLEAVRRLGITDRETCYRVYNRALDLVRRSGGAGRLDVWPLPAALKAALEGFEASNREVARRYLGREALFPLPLADYAARYEAGLLAPERVEPAAAIVAALIPHEGEHRAGHERAPKLGRAGTGAAASDRVGSVTSA